MNLEQSHSGKADGSVPLSLMPPALAAMGQKRLEDLAATQSEFVELLQDWNRAWLDRMQAEATLASEFVTKLTGAGTAPETACQDWAARRMQMATDDFNRIVAASQKFMKTGARLFSNGWSNGHGGST